ncbi:hypothetical protein [Ramlibacter sp. PS4R-6]|uniref:hypothetical protein n=1 Tax=Ramlibacter sp. PS4R-6 TaxID=3133438 RepID=UPI0030A659B2
MSYGETSTLELSSLRAPLDVDAAVALGQLLIGRSRLDLAVQLYVAALPAPRDLPPLERLLVFADSLADKTLRADFVRWIVRTRHLEPFAQALRTARWLPDPRRNVVLALGQPGLPPPPARSFTITELEAVATEQKELLGELHRLCAAERGVTPAAAASFLSTQPIDVVEQE